MDPEMSDNNSDNEDVDCSLPEVTTKYTTAAQIVNTVLHEVIAACVPGADIAEVCKLGDTNIEGQCDKVYTKKEKGRKVRKGVAFPTCISKNNLCGHFSPLMSESDKLEAGDLIKVDMGCHIDGFIAVVGHSLVVGGGEVTGRKADVLKAAWTAAEAALRAVVVGNKNDNVTELIGKSCEAFKCHPVQGILSHQMKRHVIDGVKCITSRVWAEEKIDTFQFEMNEVYGIDIVVSTGEGKPKESELRTTVYKRDVEHMYIVKSSLARAFLADVNSRYPTLPFTLRAFSDERNAKLAVGEAKRHDLLNPYPVLIEKAGEYVAQFKFTVILLPGGTKKITGIPFDSTLVKSEYEITDEELKNVLAQSANPKKKKKKARQELREGGASGASGAE